MVDCSPGWGFFTFIYFIPERRDQCETLFSLKPVRVDGLPGVRMERLLKQRTTKVGGLESGSVQCAEWKAGFWTLDCCFCA